MMKNKRNNKGMIFFTVFAALVVFISTPQMQAYLQTIVSIKGSVLEIKTEVPVDANITVFNSKGGRVFRTKTSVKRNGTFFVTGLKPGNEYTVLIDSDAHEKSKFIIAIPESDKYMELERNFYLNPSK